MTSRKEVPGKYYLIRIKNKAAYPAGEKCEHSKPGCWLIEHNGKLYQLNISTQLQKDNWLHCATDEVGEEAALAMLRWYCFICATVQKP